MWPLPGRAALCAPRVFRAPEAPAVGPGRCVCRCAAARWAGLLCVPVGGGPPARSPHASLRLGASPRSPARPRHHPPAPRPGPPAPPAPPHQLPNGTKLAPHGFIIAKTVQNSPCRRKIDQNRAFPRCRANFVTAMPSETSCWASFIPKVGAGISVGRFSSHDRPRTPIAGQGAPHINQDTQ